MRIPSAVLACVLLAACGSDLELPMPDLKTVEIPVAQAVRAAAAEVRREPSSHAAWGKLGVVYDIHGFGEQAVACYARAAELGPTEWRWPYFQGVILRDSDRSAAMQSFERAAELKSDYAPLEFYLGLGRLQEGDNERALQHFTIARDLDPSLVNPRLGLARVYLALGDVDTALAELSEAEKLAPDDAAVQRHLAQAWREKPDAARAAEADARAERSAEAPRAGGFSSMPDRVRNELGMQLGTGFEWFNRRSQALLNAGRLDQALAVWDEALQKDAKSVPALVESSRLLVAMRRFPEARERLERAVSIEPKDARLHGELAGVFGAQGQHAEALDALRSALALDPKNPALMNNLAGVLFATGDVAQGLMYVREASELLSDNADAQYNLGAALARFGQPAEALTVLERALELDPRHAAARKLRGTLFARTEQYGPAAQEFARAVADHPYDLDAHKDLGRALWKLRSYEEALTTFRKALERAPGLASIERELAWGLATCPQVQWRNGPEALEIASRLCRATSERNPQDLDILAAAQAESGDFAAAVESESKSIALVKEILEAGSSSADDPRRKHTLKLLAELEDRLERYRLGQPYRDES